MNPELFRRVALRRDFDEYRLRAGDVAMLIDRVPHPSGGEDGVVLEVFNAVGESIAVVAVPESAIDSLREDEVSRREAERITPGNDQLRSLIGEFQPEPGTFDDEEMP